MTNLQYATFLMGIMLFSVNTNAQIGVGTTALSNSSVLLEFGSEPKGIILPQLSLVNVTGAAGGTFIFDSSDRSVKVKEEKNNNTNQNWTNLTLNSIQGKLHGFSNSGEDVAGSASVIIGSDISSKSGIMVLESTTKALVLPKVSNPQNLLKGSVAGTMVYDTESGMLAIFDGSTWSYWK